MKKNINVPRLKIVEDNAVVDGHFNFQLSPTMINNDFTPIKKVSFDWCVEMPQAEVSHFGEDAIIELFAERLKQDFIRETKLKTD